MSPLHLILVLLLALIWGSNFIFIHLGLAETPPLFLCTLRFFLASVPAVLFIQRPAVPFRMVASYGLIIFGLQFAFLFSGMQAGVTPGLASMILQVSVFFNILFSVWFLKETPNRWQLLGALVSFSGVGVIAFHMQGSVSLLGFLLVISAALAWGLGNIITKKIGTTSNLALIAWGSFISCPFLLVCSLVLEGPAVINTSLHHLSWVGLMAIAYITYCSTWIGYGIWNWLLNRYPMSFIAPFTLLVPVFAMLSSVLFLGEPLQSWKIIAGLLVLSGLLLNLSSKHLIHQFSRRPSRIKENSRQALPLS